MRTLLPAALVAVLFAPAASAHAQIAAPDTSLLRPVRAFGGGHVYYARPVGEFADYVRRGFGGALHGTLLLDRAGVLGLRIDASYLGYGRETVRECIPYNSCRVSVDVTTTNNIAFVGIGPSLTAPAGLLRPYVAGQVGYTFIWTSSSLEDVDDGGSAYDSNNYTDGTFSYGGVGGFLVPLGTSSRAYLDVGARLLRNGSVRYLREGDILDNPGGPPTMNVQRSRADLVTYFVGVSVPLR
jgi:hypothetical protein